MLVDLFSNLAEDQRRLLFSILLTIPLGLIHHLISGKTFRLVYALFFGLAIQIYMYDFSALHVLVCSFVSLVLINTCDRKRVGWLVTFYCFIHLSVLHIYRMIFDYGGWRMDITTIMMMTLCKFTSFAFCYSDGQIIDHTKLNKFTQKNKIENYTFLEYFSYIYFYPTCIMGPFFEFSDFRQFIELVGDYEKIPILRSFYEAVKRLFLGLICIAIYLYLKPYISIEYYFENHSNYFFLIYFGFLFNKYKYYTGFMFAESSCIASGISLRKLEKKEIQLEEKNEIISNKNVYDYDFEKIKSVDFIFTETSMNVTEFFQHWNISIHLWLKRYIYFRIYNNPEDYKIKDRLIFAKVVTFMVSGFWHGFYPSYYIIFSHFSLAVIFEENLDYIKKNIYTENYFIIKFCNVIRISVVFLNSCYIIGILLALNITLTIKFMCSVYFLPTFIGLTALYITSQIVQKHKYSKKEKKN
jgi:lysophospholipid acyltransferase